MVWYAVKGPIRFALAPPFVWSRNWPKIGHFPSIKWRGQQLGFGSRVLMEAVLEVEDNLILGMVAPRCGSRCTRPALLPLNGCI